MSDQLSMGNVSNQGAIAQGRDAQATVNVYHYHGEPPKFPLDNLPPYNNNFVGRIELLTAIHATFQQADASIAITQAIAGLGGVGKTQLALAYAHRHKAAYDLIWQLPADEPTALDEALRQLGAALHLPVQTADAPTARQLVLSWLNGGRQRWLLLYDNADQITARDLQPYLPGGGGYVLITSRRPEWSKARVLQVDVFTPAEAAGFWQRRLADGDAPAGAQTTTDRATLAQELGYLPLALEHAAAYMTTRGKSAADYWRLYQERRQALWARTPPPDDYHATITTTWEMAFAHARSTQGAAEAAQSVLFLAPNDIPLGILKENASIFKRSGWEKFRNLFKRSHGTEILAKILEQDMLLDDALEALQAFSLLTQQDGMLTVHRLVQTVARDRMPPDLVAAWATAAVNLLAKAYPYDEHDMTTWKLSGHLLPHVVAAAELAQKLGLIPQRTAYLWNKTGAYLHNLADYPNTRHHLQRALAIDEKALGPDHPNVSIRLNNLGQLLQAVGDYEGARPYLERALAISEKALGPDHPQVAGGNNNLGSLLQDVGDYEGARPYLERALAIDEKALGPDHPNVAIRLNNLGLLLKAVGEYEGARPFMERALAIWEKALGSDHPNVATGNNNLGQLLQAVGDFEGARPFMERALAIDEKALGPDHPSVAIRLNNLGQLLQDVGDFEGARPFLERAVAIWEAKLGPDHPHTKIGRNNLASLPDEMG